MKPAFYNKITRITAMTAAFMIIAVAAVGCGNGGAPADTGGTTTVDASTASDASASAPAKSDGTTDAATTDKATEPADITVEDTTAEPETTEPETAEPETTEPDTTAEPSTTNAPDTTKAPETTKKPEPTKDPEPTVHTHSYSATKTVKPTCTERGYTTYKCGGCGDTYTEYTNANGHTLEPGCTASYDDGYTCSVCGFELYRDIFTNVFVGDITCVACGKKVDYTLDSPTCTATGTLSYTCKSCGQKYSGSIPKKIHYCTSWTSRISDYEGVITYTCTRCGQVIETEKVELVPDNFDKDYWTQFATEYAESRGLKVYYGEAPGWDNPIPASAHYAANGVLEDFIKDLIDHYIDDYGIHSGINIWWGPYDNYIYGDEYTRYYLYIGY